jgi:ribosome-binding factor A
MSKHKEPSQRQLRAGELVRRALVDILASASLRDPALQGVSVTISEVRTSPDMKHATVYCVPLGGENMAEIIKALGRCSSFLRGRLGKEMEMKFTPRLHFVADESFDVASDMTALLARPEIARDLNKDED